MPDELLNELRIAARQQDWSQVRQLGGQLNREVCAELATACPAVAPDPGASRYLVTGGAGFIGSHLASRLLKEGHRVVALDEFNDYYDPWLKWQNIAELLENPRFSVVQCDIRRIQRMRRVFACEPFDAVIHLAGRAGVRPSLTDPALYMTSNVLGTQNVLELVREFGIRNFVFASSSSVYGGSEQLPFRETQNVDSPISPYAASKKANELQAACYSRLYGIRTSGLRFFTVYGPSGRPDMAVRIFIEKLSRGEPVPLYGEGNFERDYTYVDDIVNGILGVLKVSQSQPTWTEVFNLGESDTTSVLQLILLIARELGLIQPFTGVKDLTPVEQRVFVEQLQHRGLIKRLPEQLGDVPRTYADITKARRMAGYSPQVGIELGIKKTVEWHREQGNRCSSLGNGPLQSAVTLQCHVQKRMGLDSAGQLQEPSFEVADFLAVVDNIGELRKCQDTEPQALYARQQLSLSLQEMADYV